MYFDFNVTGKDRKALVDAISVYTDAKAKYLGAPTFAYQVDRFTISKSGVVTCEETDREDIAGLLEALADQGFVSQVSDCGCEDAAQEAPDAPLTAISAKEASTRAGNPNRRNRARIWAQ